MEYKHHTEDTKGYFQLIDDSIVAAYVSYSKAGDDLIIIDHTDVKPNYKGQNLGKQLIHKAVVFARENNIKIMPICPFAASVFQKDESIRDVLR